PAHPHPPPATWTFWSSRRQWPALTHSSAVSATAASPRRASGRTVATCATTPGRPGSSRSPWRRRGHWGAAGRCPPRRLQPPVRRSGWARERRRGWSRIMRSRLERAHLLGSAGTVGTGMSIVILGPDGAGKTTLAQGLAASVPLPSRQVYMGVWRDYPWDRW